ncbi:hypothetical protein M569_05806 [Genlisea aurea]|uniref:Eukaryotic translation initiation factor 3 subunit M n=1 Tax=Genlisea aurea TaxID=192259 RepID=S8E926_9LAMI|nr:hypothetical protein M569_05806 [Genlisea aurea]
MTTVVPTSEEDPALAVVRFTAELSWADADFLVAEGHVNALCLEAQECMVQNRWLDLTSLMLTSADVIFSKASEKDLECIYTVTCNLVKRAVNLDEVHGIVELVATKICQKPSERPAVRLKILFNLYNLLDIPYSKFYVYIKALNLAISGKVTEHVLPSFKKIDTLLREWNLGVKDQRDLYLTITNILKNNKSSSSKEYFGFLVKYLETFSGEDAFNVSEAKEEAVHAVVEFIKAPDLFQSDLLEMPAVVQLEKDTLHAPLYQLLKIFLTHRLESYLDFYSSNANHVVSYGLVHEDCVAKMRLISLIDLGKSESGQIPYSLIKDALQIEEDDVEQWLVKAITAKLIDGRIDQINQLFIVSRSTERIFRLNEWQSLRSKLATWRSNIGSVINTVQASKLVQDGTQGVQGLAIR